MSGEARRRSSFRRGCNKREGPEAWADGEAEYWYTRSATTSRRDLARAELTFFLMIPAIDRAAFHHEAYLLQDADVAERIAWNGDDIREKARP